MENINDTEIYNYCEERWDFYENRDGGYYPSKHDELVFADATAKFNITTQEAMDSFNKVSKAKANEMVKNMSAKEKRDLLEKIVRNNKETP